LVDFFLQGRDLLLFGGSAFCGEVFMAGD
jgi:hypothetical protein